jgi:hypothetical protein
MMACPVFGRDGQAEQDDDEDREHEERSRVVREPSLKAHDAVARLPRADDDHEPEDEEGICEEGADDRRLRDHGLARRERKEHDEELGDVRKRRLERAGDTRSEPLTDGFGRERDDPRKAGERGRGKQEDDEIRSTRNLERDHREAEGENEEDRPALSSSKAAEHRGVRIQTGSTPYKRRADEPEGPSAQQRNIYSIDGRM